MSLRQEAILDNCQWVFGRENTHCILISFFWVLMLFMFNLFIRQNMDKTLKKLKIISSVHKWLKGKSIVF